MILCIVFCCKYQLIFAGRQAISVAKMLQSAIGDKPSPMSPTASDEGDSEIQGPDIAKVLRVIMVHAVYREPQSLE